MSDYLSDFTNEERKEILAENLRNLRQKKGFTYQWVADYIGVKKSAYGNYETGERTPNIETLVRLSKLYNISVDELLGADKTKSDLDKSIDKMLEPIKDAIMNGNEEQRQMVANMFEDTMRQYFKLLEANTPEQYTKMLAGLMMQGLDNINGTKQ